MTIRIIEALKRNNFNQVADFSQYLLNEQLKAEKPLPGSDKIPWDNVNLESFQEDNRKVISWFNDLNTRFNQWIKSNNLNPVDIVATGSRSFNASYEESDLECAVVSDKFQDFLNFSRFLNETYGEEHKFIAIKTSTGIPLLIVKGKEASNTTFHCPELEKSYPGKSLCHLEVTYRKDTEQNDSANNYNNKQQNIVSI